MDLGTESAPVRVVLAGAEATIECADEQVRHLLTGVFRHCSSEAGAPPLLDYRVDGGDSAGLRLEGSGQLLYEGEDREYLVRRLLFDLLIRLPRQQRRLVSFHAAAVTRGDRGVLICGESKSGKSTLAAWLVASGFGYLSDELVAVYPDTREMAGLARSVLLKEGSSFVWQRFVGKEDRGRLVRLSDQVTAIDPDLLRPGSVRHRARLALVLFPRYDPETALEVQELSRGESAMQLIESMVNSVVLPDRGAPATVALARACRAYSLTYSDLEQATAWLQETLADSHSMDPEGSEESS